MGSNELATCFVKLSKSQGIVKDINMIVYSTDWSQQSCMEPCTLMNIPNFSQVIDALVVAMDELVKATEWVETIFSPRNVV